MMFFGENKSTDILRGVDGHFVCHDQQKTRPTPDRAKMKHRVIMYALKLYVLACSCLLQKPYEFKKKLFLHYKRPGLTLAGPR